MSNLSFPASMEAAREAVVRKTRERFAGKDEVFLVTFFDDTKKVTRGFIQVRGYIPYEERWEQE